MVGIVQVDQPAEGFTQIQRDSAPVVATRLLGVTIPGFPTTLPPSWILDPYVRRGDLIATYQRPAPEQLRAQVYWRYVERTLTDQSGTAVPSNGLEAIVSLQTDRLDLRATLTVSHEVPTRECLGTGARTAREFQPIPLDRGSQTVRTRPSDDAPLLIVRPPQPAESLVLMAMPSDLVSLVMERSAETCRYQFQLFDEPLEKGVIRRAQLAAWFVPRDADQACALTLYDQFLSAPPPLTT
jgi:hypothetical protein